MTKKKITKSKKSPKKEQVIHIKLEYDEAKMGKTQILSSEESLLKILKTINNYKRLRNKELNKKIEIVKKTREIRAQITKLKATFPKYKVPNILKKEEKSFVKEIEDKKPEIKRRILTNTLDAQLEEIQRKLKALKEN